MTSDLIAQVRLNLESVELAARSCREMSAGDGQALYDRMQAMIELLRSTQAFLALALTGIDPPLLTGIDPLRNCPSHIGAN
jgi:hypothetical protein